VQTNKIWVSRGVLQGGGKKKKSVASPTLSRVTSRKKEGETHGGRCPDNGAWKNLVPQGIGGSTEHPRPKGGAPKMGKRKKKRHENGHYGSPGPALRRSTNRTAVPKKIKGQKTPLIKVRDVFLQRSDLIQEKQKGSRFREKKFWGKGK